MPRKHGWRTLHTKTKECRGADGKIDPACAKKGATSSNPCHVEVCVWCGQLREDVGPKDLCQE